MSKVTTKARILAEITNATANNSITPTAVGSILNEIVEFPVVDSRPYKVYTALLNRTLSGIDSPSPTVLENTLGGEVIFTRTASGNYLATLNGAFTINKTTSSIARSVTYSLSPLTRPNTINDVLLQTFSGTTSIGDNELINSFFEIRVYS